MLEKLLDVTGKEIYIDIDNTICISNEVDEEGELDYTKSIPIPEHIELVKKLAEKNNVVLFTARGMRTRKKDWKEFTLKQVQGWGLLDIKVWFDKPHYDIVIDDKAVTDFVEASTVLNGIPKVFYEGKHDPGCDPLTRKYQILDEPVVECKDIKQNPGAKPFYEYYLRLQCCNSLCHAWKYIYVED